MQDATSRKTKVKKSTQKSRRKKPAAKRELIVPRGNRRYIRRNAKGRISESDDVSGPSYLGFDKDSYPWKPDVDYRKHPARYRIGRGEQGVFICEPYKSELTPHWRFRTPFISKQSAARLFRLFRTYLINDDFVGADMARKFLQMGYTRARRYANYKGGRKYDRAHDYALKERGTGDPEKAESAAIFYEYWKKAEANKIYAARKKDWKDRYG